MTDNTLCSKAFLEQLSAIPADSRFRFLQNLRVRISNGFAEQMSLRAFFSRDSRRGSLGRHVLYHWDQIVFSLNCNVGAVEHYLDWFAWIWLGKRKKPSEDYLFNYACNVIPLVIYKHLQPAQVVAGMRDELWQPTNIKYDGSYDSVKTMGTQYAEVDGILIRELAVIPAYNCKLAAINRRYQNALMDI